MTSTLRQLRTLRTHRPSLRYNSTSISNEPLNIVFAGSDDFSITCLRAVRAEFRNNPSLISSLTVLHRAPGLTGRTRKISVEVPIRSAGQSMSLPLEQTHNHLETYTPPPGTNLLIAVSFGIFIPARILSALPFRGLNVHPSLLPRYCGAAPIHAAIMNQDTETGVTVQTLDAKKFDHGKIIEQTDPPMKIAKDEPYSVLRARLAEEGARLLIKVLREGKFRDPNMVGMTPKYDKSLAPKVGNKHERIVWDEWTVKDFVKRAEMFKSVWCEIGYVDEERKERTRCLLRGVERLDTEDEKAQPDLEKLAKLEVGMFGAVRTKNGWVMVVRAKDGWVQVQKLQLDGRRETFAGAWVRDLKERGTGRKLF